MNEPKSFASLGPSLLARKGGAKPAAFNGPFPPEALNLIKFSEAQ